MSKENGSNMGLIKPSTESVFAISSGTVYKHMTPDTAARILSNIWLELNEAWKENKSLDTINNVIAQEAVNNLG